MTKHQSAEERANELTAHIHKDCVRVRTQRNISSFLRTLEEINESFDVHDREPDGIRAMSINELNAIEAARIDKLKAAHFFEGSAEEPGTEHVEAGKAEESLCDINMRRQYGYTRLHEAVVIGDIDEVRRLIALGADREIPDHSGATPLDKAIASDQKSIAALFGFDPDAEHGIISPPPEDDDGDYEYFFDDDE